MNWKDEGKKDIYLVLIQIDRKSKRAMSNDYLPNKNRNIVCEIIPSANSRFVLSLNQWFDVAFSQKPRLNPDIAQRNQTFHTKKIPQ